LQLPFRISLDSGLFNAIIARLFIRFWADTIIITHGDVLPRGSGRELLDKTGKFMRFMLA